MTKIAIMTGSIREGRAADGVLAQVVTAVEKAGAEASVIDLKDRALPMFDSPVPPLSPDYDPQDPAVKQLIADVKEADAVIFLTPEYNGTVSAPQKNAFDWVGAAWGGKKAGVVGYNNYAEEHGGIDTMDFLLKRLRAEPVEKHAHLAFQVDINFDGSAIDEAAVATKLDELVKQLQ